MECDHILGTVSDGEQYYPSECDVVSSWNPSDYTFPEVSLGTFQANHYCPRCGEPVWEDAIKWQSDMEAEAPRRKAFERHECEMYRKIWESKQKNNTPNTGSSTNILNNKFLVGMWENICVMPWIGMGTQEQMDRKIPEGSITLI